MTAKKKGSTTRGREGTAEGKKNAVSIPFTPNPRRLRPLPCPPQEAVEMAVMEGELLARALEHPELPRSIANAVRALTCYCLMIVAKALDKHYADSELLRGVYPYARLLEADSTRGLFDSTIEDMQSSEPAFYRALLQGKGERKPRPETVTADRLAAIVEAPETPPVVRDLLRYVCVTLDCFSALPIEGSEDFAFQFDGPGGDKITPARIRRKLPAMLRRIGQWELADWQPHELLAPGATHPAMSAVEE